VARTSSWFRLVSAGVLAGAAVIWWLPATHFAGSPHAPAEAETAALPPPRPPPPPPAAPPRSAPAAARTFSLREEPPREKELAAGARDAYEIDLDAGQYLHLVVEQRGLDVSIDVFAPGGRRLFQADSPNGDWQPEHVHLLAERPGRHRFLVAAVKPGSHGAYLARIEALRPASLADRDRAAAQLAAAEASELADGSGSFWEAAARYERALRLWQGLGDLQPQAWTLRFLGSLYLGNGRSGDALPVLLRFLAVSRALGDAHDEALALNELGRAYDQLGDFESARTSYEDALRIWRSRGERVPEAMTLLNLGRLYQGHGKSWQALNCFRGARELARAMHNLKAQKAEVNALNGMGWVYASAADWQRARETREQALALANRIADRKLKTELKAITLRQLGDAHLAAGEPERALFYLGRALELQNDPKAASDRALILNSMGLCWQQQGAYEQALDAFRKALAVFEQQSSLGAAADARINLGRTYVRLHRPEQALVQYGEALQQARRGGDRTLEAVARFGMATAERERENLILALTHCQAAIQIAEALRAEALRPDLQRSYLAWHESYYDLLVDTQMSRHRQQPAGGFDRVAFESSERARTRPLLDALVTRRVLQAHRAAAGPALAARWDRLTAEIAAQDQARKRLDGTTQDRQAAERELHELLDQLNELEAELRRGAPGLAGTAAAGGAEPALDPRLGKLLDPRTLLLEYYLQEPRSFLWVISSEGRMQSFELPGRGAIEARVRSLVGLLAGTDRRLWSEPEAGREAAERESRELGRILLGQAAASLDGKRLAIAASGALQYLPFAALPDPAGHEGPLGLGHEIVYVPSLAVLAKLRERSRARARPAGLLAIVADPVFGPSDPRLRGTPAWRAKPAPGELPRLDRSRAEGDAIRALAPGERVLEWTGFEATPELVTSGALAPYRTLHFATHGTSQADVPGMSAIALSAFDRQGHPRDGYLRAQDVAHLELSADLVVLSACSTALGPEIDREGMFGLAQSFLTAGARQVLVSLWNVGDVSTAELMQRFYRHLLVDRPPPPAGEALRLAQQEMWQQPRWRTPDHWAGFVLQGDWR
jgi:CHAT domain-containing protein/tetratricopeptide (TPR) repeat protein